MKSINRYLTVAILALNVIFVTPIAANADEPGYTLDGSAGYIGIGDFGGGGYSLDGSAGYLGRDTNLGYAGSQYTLDGSAGYIGRDTNLGFVGQETTAYPYTLDGSAGYIGRDTNLGYVGRETPETAIVERTTTAADTAIVERTPITFDTAIVERTPRYTTYDVYTPIDTAYQYASAYPMTSYPYTSAYPYASSYPFYQQSYAQPFYQQPSNTTISERTDIFAPTNTCTAPNTCNSTYTDNSVFNAPTTITNPPAQTIINNAAPVSPVVVPQYTVQAYVPPTYNYPTYQQPYVQPYVSPVNPIVPSNPYVALTQIPYTGLDLGLFGNAAYWLGLAAFAVGAGYLAVYYLPSIMNRRNESFVAMSDQDEGEAEPEKKTEEKEEAASITSPITVAMPAFAVSCGGTRDSMFSIPSTDGRAPRLVISRA